MCALPNIIQIGVYIPNIYKYIYACNNNKGKKKQFEEEYIGGGYIGG